MSVVEVSGGFLTSRYGICKFYKTFSTLGPLFEKPVVWDVYGFGGNARVRSGHLEFDGGVRLNDRESGSVHGYAGLETRPFSAGILAGFQTCSPEDQNHNLTLGFESSAGAGLIRLHCAMKYLHGYAIVPSCKARGSMVNGLLEARIAPVRPLSVDLLGLYQRIRQEFSHEHELIGLDCQWRLIRWWGVAGGGEWSNSDGVESWAPELRTFVSPGWGNTQLSIGVKQSRTGRSSPLNQVTGNLCVVY
jgi:hypothetical protein